MLHLYQNALYYFRKAAALKPHDARMWNAVGQCLLKLGESSHAIAAYERAAESGDREGIAKHALAGLYKEAGQMAKAAECYEDILGGSDGAVTGGGNLEARAEGLLVLAKFYKSAGELDKAEGFAMMLASVVGWEGDEARGILREIRARQ